VGEVSALFLTWNRKSEASVLTCEQTRARCHPPVNLRSADVVMENFRPGVADSIGIGWETSATPTLASCTARRMLSDRVTVKDLPGTDPVVQAMSGVMSVTGEPAGGPCLVGIPIADYVSSMQGVQQCCLVWLLVSEQVEVNRSSVHVGQCRCRPDDAGGPYFLDGKNPTRFGSQHSQVVPTRRSRRGRLRSGRGGVRDLTSSATRSKFLNCRPIRDFSPTSIGSRTRHFGRTSEGSVRSRERQPSGSRVSGPAGALFARAHVQRRLESEQVAATTC